MSDKRISRRKFLHLTAGTGLGLLGASALAAQCAAPPATQAPPPPTQPPTAAPTVAPKATEAPTATAAPTVAPKATEAPAAAGGFNWMTWSDHYLPEQLEEAASKYGIKANPTLFSDNSEAFLKVQQVGGKQIDMVSGDALWIPQYYKEGLIEPFDIEALATAKDLFPEAKSFEFWKATEGYMAFPNGWSPVLVAYNPKYVTPAPDSWEVLWDAKYKGKIAMELQPFDVMAFMGKALGIKEAYQMNAEQVAKAKDLLKKLRPNILKFVEQNVEIVKLLADETIWLATVNVGIEDRVKDAGGPEVKTFIPKEGVVGWLDGEMLVKGAVNREAAWGWLDKMETPEWVAKNFLEYGRPLFNKAAYDILVKQGYEERAKRYLYDKPEVALTMTLKGPAPDMDLYIKAFNEAIAG
jgi:spermidine/putrescine transport system substrate-binding protein